MLTKAIIILIMLMIVTVLISGLIFLVRDTGKRSVRSLTWRIVLSLMLFAFLFLAYQCHWITPHDLSETSLHPMTQ